MVFNNIRSRGWCFTLNNWTEEDELEVWDLSTNPDVRYGVVGSEVGEEGTPHLQGYVHFHNVKSGLYVKMLLGRAHWEPKHGTVKEASDYCKKEDPNYWEFGNIPDSDEEKGNKSRAIWAEQYELAKSGQFEQLDPRFYRTWKSIREDFTDYGPETRPTLDNWWYFGKTGCGKTKKVRTENPGAYRKRADKWFDRYMGQHTLIIEDLDSGACTKDALFVNLFKDLTDHGKFPAEKKGGYIDIRPMKVVITSNHSPWRVFGKHCEQADFAAIARRFEGRCFMWIEESEEWAQYDPYCID